MERVICTIVAGILLVVPGMAANAFLQYPAQGHFDPREGALEIWFSIDGEPGETNDLPFTLFDFKLPEAYTLTISYNASNKRFTVRPAEKNPVATRRMMNNLWEEKIFEKGRLHHLAFTWRGTEMTFYLDGELIGSRNQAMGFGGPLGDAVLTLGDARQSHGAEITFTAFKLSDRFLKEEDLRERTPKADIHTLLLDEFEVWPPDESAEPRSSRVQASYYGGSAD